MYLIRAIFVKIPPSNLFAMHKMTIKYLRVFLPSSFEFFAFNNPLLPSKKFSPISINSGEIISELLIKTGARPHFFKLFFQNKRAFI